MDEGFSRLLHAFIMNLKQPLSRLQGNQTLAINRGIKEE
jgi:hypothetical protein